MIRRGAIGLLALVILVLVGLATWEPFSAPTGTAPADAHWRARIVRDAYGVPHIFGHRDADVAYGVAWAHAEDDFATLQEVAAMTRGRDGALTGAEGAQADYVLALTDARGAVNRHYDELSPAVRAVLDGYAAGLNAYAAAHPGEVRLARLFPLNGRDIAAGFTLRSPFFFGLGDTIAALVAGKPVRPEGGPALDTTGHETGPATPVDYVPGAAPDPGPGGSAALDGSNGFAVAARRSDDDTTRLISNSHQPWRGQVAWYELVVQSDEGLHFAGATFPGSPFVLLGHNEHLGWTNTVNRPDLTDIYRLTLDADGTHYRMDGRWLPLERHRIWLHVRFGPFVLPVPKMIYRAIQGPVIENAHGAFAIRYAGIDTVRMVEQYYRLQKAQDFAAWQRAMAIQGVPATNFIYADQAGHIGLFYNALFPDRPMGADWRHIVPGDRHDLVWHHWIPWRAVPHNVDPPSGFIFNSNNSPYVAAGPGSEIDPARVSPLLGVERDMTNRARRAVALLEQPGPISAARLARIKWDTCYQHAGYAQTFLGAVDRLDLRREPDLARAQALLRNWNWCADGKGPADALAVVILHEPMTRNYQRRPLPDPHGELVKAVAYLMKYYGRIDPPLGTVERLRQGHVDLPMDGGPDTLRAATNWDIDPRDGRLDIKHGDSFIMFVAWPHGGAVRSQSILPYGSATTRPDSPHFADQARLFVEHRLKPVWFTRADVMAHAASDEWVGDGAGR